MYAIVNKCGRLVVAALVGLATLTTWQSAKAGPLEIELTSLGAGADVVINYQNRDWYVFAGQFHMAYLNGPRSGQQFDSFCVDLDHEVFVGQTYQVNPRSTAEGLNQGPKIAYLYNKYGTASLTDNTEAAALQLALWSEVADGGGDLTQGPFKYLANNAIADRTNQFLAEAASHSASGEWLDASANGYDLYRGQSVPVPSEFGPDVPVPEPVSWALLGTGAAGLACYRRWSRRCATGG